jgi:hypothetical protein
MSFSSKDDPVYEMGAVGASTDVKDSKGFDSEQGHVTEIPGFDTENQEGTVVEAKATDQSVIGSTALHVQDDPSLNPWTFRFWFLGMYKELDSSSHRAEFFGHSPTGSP